MTEKKILFITGTRADFGKLKPLMRAVDKSSKFELFIFVTGMHTLSRYGLTQEEVENEGFKNIHVFMNQFEGEPMELILANTIIGLSRYIREYKPDLIIVHGDRIEALAGAIAGAIKNILVAHIEGGEKSGTVDEILRHSISKLSHIHFVSNNEASERIKQLGENPNNIFVIGSPDIDIMLSPNLPALSEVREHYEIFFDNYSIAIFHPVTTELDDLEMHANEFVSALLESKLQFVIILPNNDEGCSEILKTYKRLNDNPHIRMLPSMRFEYFLTLLKNADFIVGNSSVGIHEAPVYGIYTIDVGSRQKDRCNDNSIIHVNCQKQDILNAINRRASLPKLLPSTHFGDGQSTQRFMKVLDCSTFWTACKQKEFVDILPSLQKRSGQNEFSA